MCGGFVSLTRPMKESMLRRYVPMLGPTSSTTTRVARLSTSHFSGVLSATELKASPLDELRCRSAARGLCDADGFRLQGAPWGMQLAHASGSGEPWPVVRTVGFQAVRSDGFTFLLKRRPCFSAERLAVAINYVEGRFVSGEVCEQWRAEGFADEVHVDEVLKTAPLASMAQIIATNTLANDGDMNGRVRLADRDAFVDATGALKRRLVAGEVPADELRHSVIVYRMVPLRMELMLGGPDFPMWERWEWQRDSEDGDRWALPSRIAPY